MICAVWRCFHAAIQVHRERAWVIYHHYLHWNNVSKFGNQLLFTNITTKIADL